ncbi:MAG: hypothetical protein PHE43_03635 [Candidatus Nanoarchaeia archaeon]|nr:hypothetical protein [Candidatus Nanoarchaeia archaeon]
MNYIQYSKRREKEAVRIMDALNIQNQIPISCKIIPVGSFSLHTMIKPDLDFVIKVSDGKHVKLAISALHRFFKKDNKFFNISIEDRPSLAGKSIHAQYKSKSNWKFDILVSTNNLKKYYELKNLIDKKMTPDKKRIILNLKYYFYMKRLYVPALSMHIYDAVLKKNIKNTREFISYLESIGVKRSDFIIQKGLFLN